MSNDDKKKTIPFSQNFKGSYKSKEVKEERAESTIDRRKLLEMRIDSQEFARVEMITRYLKLAETCLIESRPEAANHFFQLAKSNMTWAEQKLFSEFWDSWKKINLERIVRLEGKKTKEEEKATKLDKLTKAMRGKPKKK